MYFEDDYEKIGKRIKRARIRAKLTQVDLYKLTGISITQISAYENGNRHIGLDNLRKIAIATKTTMDEIYLGSEAEKPVLLSTDVGKLIINCVMALYDNGVITVLQKERNDFLQMGLEYYYQIGFENYVEILDDFVKKIKDFNNDKADYPNPNDFKNQLIEAAAKKINNQIAIKNKRI